MLSSENLGLVLTSAVSLIVGLMAHRVQLVSSKNDRKSAREAAENDSLNAMISALRTEIRELRQVNVDLRELYHKTVLENQALQHKHSQVQYRLEEANGRLVELQKENLTLREERIDCLQQKSDESDVGVPS